MKNEFELSNEFEVLSDGSFQFKRKVSLIQFLGGFIFAGIPIFALLLVRRKLLWDFLFREAGSFDWQLKYDTLQLKYAYENHKVIEEINLTLVFILVYISTAIFYRNILFKITKNHKITLDKLNKIVHFEFYKKSFAIPFAELSHFKIRIEKEMSGARGRPLVKVYVVCLAKKDGEEYELMRYRKRKESADKFLEYIKSEFTFESSTSSTTYDSPSKTPVNSTNNGFVWSRKVRWYFWTNCLVYLLITFYFVDFAIKYMADTKHFSELIFFLFIMGLNFFGVYLVAILSARAIKHVFLYNEIAVEDDGIALYRISKVNNAKKLMNKIPFDEILTIRQMPINNGNYIGNVGIAIISKKDAHVLEKEQDTFTKKFINSIGFQLEDDDYAESVLVEKYIETKLPK